jgi:hypothetical protein
MIVKAAKAFIMSTGGGNLKTGVSEIIPAPE